MKISKKKGIAAGIAAIAVSASILAFAGTASANVGTNVVADSVGTVVQDGCFTTVVETKFNIKEKMIKGRWDGDTFTGDVNASYPGGYGWKTVGNEYFAPDAWPTEDDPTFTKGDFIHDNGGTWYWTIYQQWDNSGGTREVQVPAECPPVVLDDPTVSITCSAVTITNPNDSSLFATIIEPDAFTDGIEIAGGTSLVLPFPEYNVSELYVYVGETDYYQNADVQYPVDCGVTDPPPVVDPPVDEVGPVFSGTPPVVDKAAPANW